MYTVEKIDKCAPPLKFSKLPTVFIEKLFWLNYWFVRQRTEVGAIDGAIFSVFEIAKGREYCLLFAIGMLPTTKSVFEKGKALSQYQKIMQIVKDSVRNYKPMSLEICNGITNRVKVCRFRNIFNLNLNIINFHLWTIFGAT